jgi:hypothetical protein
MQQCLKQILSATNKFQAHIFTSTQDAAVCAVAFQKTDFGEKLQRRDTSADAIYADYLD